MTSKTSRWAHAAVVAMNDTLLFTGVKFSDVRLARCWYDEMQCAAGGHPVHPGS